MFKTESKCHSYIRGACNSHERIENFAKFYTLCNLRVFALRFWIGPLSDLIKKPRFLWRSYTRQSYSLDWEFECLHLLSLFHHSESCYF
jgi:hypothetical protein